MNWQTAVEISNWLAANLAHKTPQGPWPLGGWETIGESAANVPELRRRIALLLALPDVAASERGRALAAFVASLGSPPPSPPKPKAEAVVERDDEYAAASPVLDVEPEIDVDPLDEPPALDVEHAVPGQDIDVPLARDSDPFGGLKN